MSSLSGKGQFSYVDLEFLESLIGKGMNEEQTEISDKLKVTL